jgi:ABC-2 type transport system ATP-binding protein
VAILVSSHILSEVAQIADSVVILDRGRLVTHASLTQLLADTAPTVRVRTPAVERLGPLLTADGATVTTTAREWLDVSGSSPERIGTLAALHAIPIYETTLESADLEDVFLRLTTRSGTPQEST